MNKYAHTHKKNHTEEKNTPFNKKHFGTQFVHVLTLLNDHIEKPSNFQVFSNSNLIIWSFSQIPVCIENNSYIN